MFSTATPAIQGTPWSYPETGELAKRAAHLAQWLAESVPGPAVVESGPTKRRRAKPSTTFADPCTGRNSI